MNKELIRKWVAALRSGKYKQQRNACLRDKEGYCCLGVLTDVAKETEWVYSDVSDNYGLPLQLKASESDYVEKYYLPKQVRESVGFASDNPSVSYMGIQTNLSRLNDGLQLSFEQIADLVEQEYLNG